MTQIITEVYDAFRAAGVDDTMAKAAAGALSAREHVASKSDIVVLKGEFSAEIAALRAEVSALRSNVDSLRSDVDSLRSDVDSLRSHVDSLKGQIADVKADLKLLKFAYGPVIIGLLVKLTFFP